MRALLLPVLLFISGAAIALADDVPFLSGPVVDEAGLLTPEQRMPIEQALLVLQQSKRAQMAVLIAKTIGDTDITSYGVHVFERWKLGDKKQDQGLLLVVAPQEHQMRFVVGRGLEGDIPDITAKHILDRTIAPYFRQNRYADGILAAVQAVGKTLGVSVDGPLPLEDTPQRPFPLSLFVMLLLLAIVWLIRRFGGGGGGNYWSGGGGFGGGGFGGGFGGGGFGGGGGGGGFSGGGGDTAGGGAGSSW